MALNIERLKGKIITVFDECQKETDNPQGSKELLAEKLATAIVEEIQALTITYTSGLIALNGAVVGVFNAKIT